MEKVKEVVDVEEEKMRSKIKTVKPRKRRGSRRGSGEG